MNATDILNLYDDETMNNYYADQCNNYIISEYTYILWKRIKNFITKCGDNI